MTDLEDLVERLTNGPGPASEPHSASDSAGLVTLETGPEVRVHLSEKAGVNPANKATLEEAIGEALGALLNQDSPFARTLVSEIHQHLDLDQTQARMRDQVQAWQERSVTLQGRIRRARDSQK